MTPPENNITNLKKAFGNQDYVLFNKDYQDLIEGNPLIQGLWTVGQWFSFLANTQTWKLEYATGNCLDVCGYTPAEIINIGKDFVAKLIGPDDFNFVNQAIHQAMTYVHELPVEERKHVYVVFYNRAVRKDGSLTVIQNQNVPLVFDANNIPYVFINVITDISRIRPTNIPQAVIINKHSQTRFYLDENHMKLSGGKSVFTPREREIIELLIKGYSSRKIAEELFISYETARTHRKNILQKAGVSNTGQLISYVLLNSIV